MNPNQSKHLLAAARIFARKSSQIHASRPFEQNSTGHFICPPNPVAPGQGTVVLPVLKPYQMPVLRRWASNVSAGNPPPLHKNPPNQRDLRADYSPFAL